jgi:hypothetical protein
LQAVFEETERNYRESPNPDERDPIDYARIATLIDRRLRPELLQDSGQHREGFVRAMAHFLARHCDPAEWGSLQQLERTGAAARPRSAA